MSFPRFAYPCIALLAVAAVPAWAANAGGAAAELAEIAPTAELRLVRTIALPAGTTVEKARAAVILSLERYRWLVHVVEPDRVIAFYARQPLMVALTVKLLPGRIELWLRGVGPAEKLQVKETQWLNNLVSDTSVTLGLVAPASAPAGKD